MLSIDYAHWASLIRNVACAPIDLLRGRRMKLHNATVAELLEHLGAETSVGGYRDAGRPPASGVMETLRYVHRALAVNCRIERGAGLAFCGVALMSRSDLVCFTVHGRSSSQSALRASTLGEKLQSIRDIPSPAPIGFGLPAIRTG